ncbi:hypothetical protein GRJ2_000982600 [Grus japonensis]|uniref:Uncharacterized protein n=1 Tax=Grus japonensis TaxID=30415 RepID=A0ABC9WI76_GRUJA
MAKSRIVSRLLFASRRSGRTACSTDASSLRGRRRCFLLEWKLHELDELSMREQMEQQLQPWFPECWTGK